MDAPFTRRGLLRDLLTGTVASATFPSPIRLIGEPPAAGLERDHEIRIRAPLLAHDGANVPLALSMNHPMAPDHYIARVGVYVFEDPLVTKGIFYLSPQVGAVRLALQARLNAGANRVFVTAECTRHGTWAASRPLKVSTGGCHTVGVDPKTLAEPPGSVAPPRIYAPDAVRPGEVFEVRIKVKHPSRTGLRLLPDGRTFERAEDALFAHTLELYYGRSRLRPRLVSRVEMTSVMSDDPLFIFALRADQGGALGAVVHDNRGRRFESVRQVALSR